MIFWKFEIFKKCPGLIFQKKKHKKCVLKNPVLPGSKIPLLAIHKIISHIWEDGSRKVNNDEPDLRFLSRKLVPVISQAVRKPCFSTSIPRGPNPPPCTATATATASGGGGAVAVAVAVAALLLWLWLWLAVRYCAVPVYLCT